MITLVDKKHIISVNSKLLFSERLGFISEILKNVSNDFIENEEELENKFWLENGILDQTDLSKDDFEVFNEQLETFKDKHKHLPQILYKSLIVSIYSILETTLSELINSTEKKITKRIKYKNLRNNGNQIENYLNYFNLVHNLEFSNLKKLLKDLKNYTDIRNNIVHFNGSLKDDNQSRKERIKKFVSNDKNIEIESNENLYIKNCDYVIKFISLTEKFGYELFENYKI